MKALSLKPSSASLFVFILSWTLLFSHSLQSASPTNSDLKPKAAQTQSDANGNSPLHLAALHGDLPEVRSLLEQGSDPNATNNAGATPLLYGTGDAKIVRKLLESGANPNTASTNGQAPLLAAVVRDDSYEVVNLLLKHGANVRAQRTDGTGFSVAALPLAIQGGDHRSIELLINSGAPINTTNGFSSLAAAAFVGDLQNARRLLDLGADPNYNSDFAGHSLNFALYGGHPDVAALLITNGADLQFASPWGHKTPPIVWSAYNEQGDTTIAKLLLERGVDLNSHNEAAETALTYALKRGSDTPLAKYLQSAGAEASGLRKLKPTPARSTPASASARLSLTRQSVEHSVALLQRSSTAFLDNAFVRKSQCASCHQQTLPAIAFGWARARGIKLNDGDISRLLIAESRVVSDHAEEARQMSEPQPDAPIGLSYGFLGLHALGYRPDEKTEAGAHYLLKIQRREGFWPSFDIRPPLEDGLVTATALSVRALQLFAPRGKELKESTARARRWLAAQQASTHSQRAFQLLGLGWAGAPASERGRFAKRLLSDQRQDGGWAQLPGLESDAWATGQALVALHEGGGLPVSDSGYQHGVEFLLRTQFDDGSWWVRSRTWPFQPHFDSQFPHGKDQWISAAGTTWATMALLLTIEPTTSNDVVPPAQLQLTSADSLGIRDFASTSITAENSPKFVKFEQDIKPVLERSCIACHSGDKPKGGMRLDSLEGLLKGGQSGEPAVRPKHPDQSPIVQFISDKVEDLEMPPLSKRNKYPSLSATEIGQLRNWIAEGAVWPEKLTLSNPKQ